MDVYSYEEPSLFAGQRATVLLAVVLLHLAMGYALVNGLATSIVRFVIPEISVSVEKPAKPPRTPPPPPIIERVPIYVLPLDPLEISAPENSATSVRGTSTVPVPPVPAPRPVNRVGVRVDPRHPLHIGSEYYPDPAKRLGEEGTCRVQVRVSAEGRVVNATLVQSAGSSRLDEACVAAVRGQRMLPATEDGMAVESTAVLPIRWELKDDR